MFFEEFSLAVNLVFDESFNLFDLANHFLTFVLDFLSLIYLFIFYLFLQRREPLINSYIFQTTTHVQTSTWVILQFQMDVRYNSNLRILRCDKITHQRTNNGANLSFHSNKYIEN